MQRLPSREAEEVDMTGSVDVLNVSNEGREGKKANSWDFVIKK